MSFLSFLGQIIPWAKSFVGDKLLGGGGKSSLTKPPPPPPSSVGINEDFLHSGTWLTMASSNVEATRYLWDAEVLEVEFKGRDKHGEGYLYQYFGVKPSVAHDFTTTDSPGRYVWNHLRDRYPYTRMHGFAATAPKAPNVVRQPSEAELQRKGINPGSLASGLIPPWQVKPWSGRIAP